MRIRWSPLSVDRLSEIAEYIARDNPRAAERWIDEIFVKVEQLKSFPDMVPIPLIPPCDSDGSRHRVPGEAAIPSERSDAGVWCFS